VFVFAGPFVGFSLLFRRFGVGAVQGAIVFFLRHVYGKSAGADAREVQRWRTSIPKTIQVLHFIKDITFPKLIFPFTIIIYNTITNIASTFFLGSSIVVYLFISTLQIK
jgi:hypothetical protein